MKIDARFLGVHPATAEWWERRKECSNCKHMIKSDDGAMRCDQSTGRAPGMDEKGRLWHVRRNMHDYCIDARSEGGVCGPDAVLFSAGRRSPGSP